MKTAFALLALAFAGSAHAQFSGTVTGSVTATDARTNPYSAAGHAAAPPGARQSGFGGVAGGQRALAEALVHLTVVPSFGLPSDLWVRTNSTGAYTIPWTAGSRPASLRVEVFATRPDITAGTVASGVFQPPIEFRITTAGISDIVLGSRTIAPAASSGLSQAVNFAFGSSEIIGAFRTARETYAMFDANGQPATGGSMRNDMAGVDIFANASVPGVPTGAGGMAPSEGEVLLAPGTANPFPFTVAHELGHILEYRSLDVILPPAMPAQYERDQPFVLGASNDFSDEFEKAAFQEGFAHVVAGLWMWNRNADPAPNPNPNFPGSFGPTSLETTSQHPTGGAACTRDITLVPGTPPITVEMGHRRRTCIARGLWDLVDNPASDGDAFQGRDLGDLVQVLRAYPRGCLWFADNGCVNEPGDDDGMNWADFRSNWQATFGSSLGNIESGNDLNNSDTN